MRMYWKKRKRKMLIYVKKSKKKKMAKMTTKTIMKKMTRMKKKTKKILMKNQIKIQHKCNNRRSEEHTSELQSRGNLVCRLLLEKKKNFVMNIITGIISQTGLTNDLIN